MRIVASRQFHRCLSGRFTACGDDFRITDQIFISKLDNWGRGRGGGFFLSEKLTDPFLPDDVRIFVIQIYFIQMKIYQRKNKQTIYKTIKFKTNKLMKKIQSMAICVFSSITPVNAKITLSQRKCFVLCNYGF